MKVIKINKGRTRHIEGLSARYMYKARFSNGNEALGKTNMRGGVEEAGVGSGTFTK